MGYPFRFTNPETYDAEINFLENSIYKVRTSDTLYEIRRVIETLKSEKYMFLKSGEMLEVAAVRQTTEVREKHKKLKLAIVIDSFTKKLAENFRSTLISVKKILKSKKQLHQVLKGSTRSEIASLLSMMKNKHTRLIQEELTDSYWRGKRMGARELKKEMRRTKNDFENISDEGKKIIKFSFKLMDDVAGAVDFVLGDANIVDKFKEIDKEFISREHRISKTAVAVIWAMFHFGYMEEGIEEEQSIYWVTMGDHSVCSVHDKNAKTDKLGCKELGDGSPYKNASDLPTVPQGMETQCMNGCRCTLSYKSVDVIIPMEEPA